MPIASWSSRPVKWWRPGPTTSCCAREAATPRSIACSSGTRDPAPRPRHRSDQGRRAKPRIEASHNRPRLAPCCSPAPACATEFLDSPGGFGCALTLHALPRRPHLPMSTLEERRASQGGADPPSSPSLSPPFPAPELTVVVPTFNERDNIPRLIDLLKLALAQIAWELIIVDDNSPDGTAEVAKRIGSG